MTTRLRDWLIYRGNRPFTWLWWSHSVSLFGSQISLIAIPLLAAISLGAGAFEMGLLAAVEMVPYLVLSIPAGVLVDRVDRRPLLLLSNLGRAALLLAIPVTVALGSLSLVVLYAVAFAVGCLSVLFDVAYQSYVPELLEPDELLGGNQRIEISESAARTAGPGIGGALVAAFGGGAAIIADALSYLLASAALLGAVHTHRTRGSARKEGRRGRGMQGPAEAEPPTPDPGLEAARKASEFLQQLEDRGVDGWDYVAALEARLAEVERRLALRDDSRSRRYGGTWTGLGIVLRDRVLRDMAVSTAIFNLASSAIMAVFILYAARDLGMDATAIGILIGAANIGFILGALAVGAVTAQLGVGATLAASAVLGAVATVLLPFAVGPAAVALLFGGRFIGALAIPLFNVNTRALRQGRAPRAALGRVNGVFRLVDWGTLPIGALLGGWIGSAYGLRATLVLGGLLGIASAAWLIVSPLRRVRGIDADDAGVAPAPATLPSQWSGPRLVGANRIGRFAAGSLGAIGRLEIQWSWLAIGGLAIQLVLFFPGIDAFGAATPLLYVASTAAVLACVLRNARLPGFPIIALGGGSNLLAIVANGGAMPVSPEAAQAAGHTLPAGHVNTVVLTDPALQPLTDILVVPPPLPLANVYSVGDVIIVLGLAVTLIWAIRRPASPPSHDRRGSAVPQPATR